GFLGLTTYPVMGSADQGGVVGNGFPPYGAESPTASGHPKKSYSVFVVLGLHSPVPDPVDAQVLQIENVQAATLTAAIRGVRPTGPAGVNRSDSVTYQPVGWNHVYGAWAVQASGSQVDVNLNPGGGTLHNPLIIVSGWTTDLPTTVRFNGVPQTQDLQYFPSVRAGAQELWITLNRDLA